jgi:hypothetical protein
MSGRRESQRCELTEELISSLEYPYIDESGTPKQRYMVYDISAPGFAVRVYPSGRKTYVMRYSIDGQRRLITLAQCAYMTLADARRMAWKVRDEIDSGIDPLERGESS